MFEIFIEEIFAEIESELLFGIENDDDKKFLIASYKNYLFNTCFKGFERDVNNQNSLEDYKTRLLRRERLLFLSKSAKYRLDFFKPDLIQERLSKINNVVYNLAINFYNTKTVDVNYGMLSAMVTNELDELKKEFGEKLNAGKYLREISEIKTDLEYSSGTSERMSFRLAQIASHPIENK